MKEREKGLKEVGTLLTKILESNPEKRKDIYEWLISQVTKKGRVDSDKISKNGFLSWPLSLLGRR